MHRTVGRDRHSTLSAERHHDPLRALSREAPRCGDDGLVVGQGRTHERRELLAVRLHDGRPGHEPDLQQLAAGIEHDRYPVR